jgi:NitT/TauT family transport system ATP-binding protein
MMATTAVSIEGLSLSYFTPERQTLALSSISLAVARGEFVAIVGQSGCGKSTLLSLIAGLMLPSAGSVMVNGAKVRAPSPSVGYMLQQDTLFEWRSILDNVLLGAEIMGRRNAATRQRAADLLVRYGLGDFLRHFPHQLSGGMRQRAALARTLCTQPDILLLDEPFSALDFQTRLALSDEIGLILRDEGKTAILVTHDIGEAISMADRIVVMTRRPGRIKSEHAIAFPSFAPARPSPFQARKCPEFNTYFQTIWDELEVGHGE